MKKLAIDKLVLRAHYTEFTDNRATRESIQKRSTENRISILYLNETVGRIAGQIAG